MKSVGKRYLNLGMSLCLMAFCVYVVLTAMKWPIRTSLFPLVIGVPVFFFALAEFLFDLYGEKDKKGAAQDVEVRLPQSEEHALKNKKTIEIFLWIIGFLLLIQLVGFSLSIPIYFIGYMRLKSKETWIMTIALSIVAWLFFYGLFVRLLHTPLQRGWIQMGLYALGILN